MKKEHVLIVTIVLALILSSSFFLDDSHWINLFLAKPQGNIFLTFVGGAIFFFIQKYFDLRQDERLKAYEEGQRKFPLMLDFINREDYYNFFTPNHKDSKGGWFVYSLRPVRDQQGNPVVFNYMNNDEHLLYVEDIAFRDVLEEEVLIDYISGPLELGTSYYLKFKNGNWYLIEDFSRKEVEIERFGKVGPVVNKPTATGLALPHIANKPVSGFRKLGSFIFNKDGETRVRSGTMAEVYINDNDNKTYIKLGHEDKTREFYVTYQDGDHFKENPYIKIELVEGHFSSSLALETFKNFLSEFCNGQGVLIREVDFYNDNLKGQ